MRKPPVQLDLFTDYEGLRKQEQIFNKEKNIHEVVIGLRKRYGKNTILD